MKNFFKFFGVIALVAVMGFSMAACEDDSDNSGNTGGSGSKDFTGTWEGKSKDLYDDEGEDWEITVKVVITGDSIKITANSKEFEGTLEAVTESTFAGLTDYSRAISGSIGSGVSKWSDENTITLTFYDDDDPFDIGGGWLRAEKMAKK